MSQQYELLCDDAPFSKGDVVTVTYNNPIPANDFRVHAVSDKGVTGWVHDANLTEALDETIAEPLPARVRVQSQSNQRVIREVQIEDPNQLIKEVTTLLATLAGSYLTHEKAKAEPTSWGEQRRILLDLQGRCFNFTLAHQPEHYGFRVVHGAQTLSATKAIQSRGFSLAPESPAPEAASSESSSEQRARLREARTPEGSLVASFRAGTRHGFELKCRSCGKKYHTIHRRDDGCCINCLPF